VCQPQQSTRTIRAQSYWPKLGSPQVAREPSIWMYAMTDKIKKGEVKVAFCPTHNILADFFTKPLQGSMFVRMREKILNLPASENADAHRIVLEIVKNKKKLDVSKRIHSNPMMSQQDNKANDRSWAHALRTSS